MPLSLSTHVSPLLSLDWRAAGRTGHPAAVCPAPGQPPQVVCAHAYPGAHLHLLLLWPPRHGQPSGEILSWVGRVFLLFLTASNHFYFRASQVESMKYGGLAWFTDLTVADPLHILPLTTAASMLLVFEVRFGGCGNVFVIFFFAYFPAPCSPSAGRRWRQDHQPVGQVHFPRPSRRHGAADDQLPCCKEVGA